MPPLFSLLFATCFETINGRPLETRTHNIEKTESDTWYIPSASAEISREIYTFSIKPSARVMTLKMVIIATEFISVLFIVKYIIKNNQLCWKKVANFDDFEL